MRYIDVDKFAEKICNFQQIDEDAANAMIWLLRAFPTADVVEVRHGEWGFDGLGWTCSECGEYALTNKSKVQVHSTYCPHCGAKMDGERKDHGT